MNKKIEGSSLMLITDPTLLKKDDCVVVFHKNVMRLGKVLSNNITEKEYKYETLESQNIRIDIGNYPDTGNLRIYQINCFNFLTDYNIYAFVQTEDVEKELQKGNLLVKADINQKVYQRSNYLNQAEAKPNQIKGPGGNFYKLKRNEVDGYLLKNE